MKKNAFTFRHRLLEFLRDMPLADLPLAKNYTLFEPYTVLLSKDCRTNGSTCGAKVNHNFWRYHRNEKFGILWAKKWLNLGRLWFLMISQRVARKIKTYILEINLGCQIRNTCIKISDLQLVKLPPIYIFLIYPKSNFIFEI